MGGWPLFGSSLEAKGAQRKANPEAPQVAGFDSEKARGADRGAAVLFVSPT